MQKGEDLDFGTRPVYDAEDLRLQKRAQRQSSWLNVLRIISRILDLVTSAGTIAMMLLNLTKYYQTQHDQTGSQPLWSANTFTWPNFLTLASATITFLAACVVLFTYCCAGRAAAERMDDRRASLAKVLMVVQVAAAAAGAVAMFKTRGNPESLSGQTCGAPPQKAPLFPEINFDRFCLMQDISTGLLLVKVFTGLVSIFGYILGSLDSRTKKKIKKRSQSGGNNGFALAPIGDVTRTQRSAADTRYTTIDQPKGRYE